MRISTVKLILTLGLSLPFSRLVYGDLSGRVIGLDPGHGEGHNPGVCVAEGTWVLDGAFRTRTRLEGRGATVVMTRTTGADPDIPTRYDILNSNNCHIAVSIHSNAAGPAVQGMETFRCSLNPHPGSSITLAEHIQDRAVSMVKGPDRGVKECLDAGHGYHFGILRYTNMPAALPEYYFHTNEYENCQIHDTEAGREDIALSLYAAVCDYYSVDPFPDPSPTPDVGPTPVSVIVDDEDPGFSAVGDHWGVSTWGANYGDQKHYSAEGTGAGFAVWTAVLPARGYYDLDAWVNDADYAEAVYYRVYAEDGAHGVELSHRRTGGGWSVALGNYLFSSPAAVEISDDASTGWVVADAVRFTLTAEIASPTPVPTATPSPTPSSSPPPPPTTTPSPPPPAPAEFRAFMADAWNEGIKDAGQVAELVAAARDHNFNAVIVQVRKRGDAYYFPAAPNVEPRAGELAPGFDPLAEVISQARAEGLEAIAWINTYLVASPPPAPPPSAPDHIFNRHPEYLTKNSSGGEVFSEGYYLDPGHPGANAWNRAVVLDLVSNYDLDGLLLDYFRYPAADSGYNQHAIERYNAEFGLSGQPDPDDPLFRQWRRRQLSDWLRVIYAEAMFLRPDLKLLAAVSQDGDHAFSAHYQDWTAWLEEKTLDAFIPMNYTADNPVFATRAGAANLAKGDRHCYMGQGSYLNPKENTVAQLETARLEGSEGLAAYSYRNTNNSGDGPAVFYQHLKDNVFSAPAPIPGMDWKDSPVSGIIFGGVSAAGGGEGIYNALVEVAGSGRHVLTGSGGRYALIDMAGGTYSLIVSAPGFKNRLVTGVNLSPGDAVTVDFELEPEFTPVPTPVSTPEPTPTETAAPTPAATPSPTPRLTPTPTIIKCFRVEGKVVERGSGIEISGVSVRLVIGGRRSAVGETGSSGYDLEICTHLPEGVVRAQARHPGHIPGWAEAGYLDWAGEGVVEMGEIELERSSVYLPGLVSGDYDGDGRADIAVFRPTSGLWAIRDLSRVYFGRAGDELVPADYTGDGRSDVAVFRPASGLWAIRGLTRIYFGGFEDVPVPGDYRGDGTATVGIFRPVSGLWAIRNFTRAYFGSRYDQPMPGDYSGAGTAVPAVFRPASGLWAIRGVSRFYFGRSGDLLVPGDYDGLGYRAAGVFRPSSGLWAIRGVTRVYFGRAGDWPVPADYRGRSLDETGIFRPGSGMWAVRGVTRAYFGTADDLPATR